MTDRDRDKNEPSREPRRDRDLAGSSYGATEREQPDRTRRSRQRAERAMRAVHIGVRDGRAGVPVRDELPIDLRAQRKVDLEPGSAQPRALPRASGRQDDTESWREPHGLLAA